MHRYFVQLQYKGTKYGGWQSQPNTLTVQDEIEANLSKILQKEIKIIGCGRTDAGVHASDYFFHFDSIDLLDSNLLFKMNMIVSKDISFTRIRKVNNEAHARFDAIQRTYNYHIHQRKDPFNQGLSYYYPNLFKKDLESLNHAAKLLLDYSDFFTFCKTNHDAKTTICKLSESRWEISEGKLMYVISSDRFLRGMVRLIVGCCINIATGNVELAHVQNALDKKERLKKDLSAPAQGLFLSKITYPETIYTEESSPYIY